MKQSQRSLFLLLLILANLGAMGAVRLPQQDWLELQTESFSILYTVDDYPLAYALQNTSGPMLDQFFDNLNAIFDVELPPPLTIRIYPDIDSYNRLNATAPSVQPNATHSRIGRREIALFSYNIFRQETRWDDESLAALFFEMVILFSLEAAQNQAPAGLLVSVGAYAQDPALISLPDPANIDLENLDWLAVWQDQALRLSPERMQLGASMVAYLVDAKGWAAFLVFLKSLPQMENLEEALHAQYDLDLTALQARWKIYWHYYLSDRWAVNYFHAYDLDRYETLLAAGAYQDAALGLAQAVSDLAYLDQPLKLEKALLLQEQAQQGVMAGAHLLSAQQAVIEGEYALALTELSQAEAIYYEELGDFSRQEELIALRNHAETVLNLRSRVDVLLQESSSLWLQEYQETIAEMEAVTDALGKLGDLEGQSAAQAAYQMMLTQRRQRQWMLIGVGGLVVFAAAAGIFYLNRRKPRAEGEL